MAKINVAGLMSAKSKFNKAKERHPELVKFAGQCKSSALVSGTTFSILAVTPDGQQFEVQTVLTDEDLDLISSVIG
ncbi:MAG: hypothetical protein ACOYJH_03675 [Anaerovoracaceae bacterium]|jgi:hypothetical protein